MELKSITYVYLLFVCWLLLSTVKGRVEYIDNKGELFEGLKKLYRHFSGYVFILAGEANKTIYQELYTIAKNSFKSGRIRKFKIIVGPEISIYPEDRVCLHSDGRAKDISCFINLHPLFKLLSEFPDMVEIYYKMDSSLSNQKHFALMLSPLNSCLYVKALHLPHEESKAILIYKPNIVEILRYLLKFLFIVHFKNVKRLRLDEESVKCVRFNDFSSYTFRGEVHAGTSF